MSKAQVTIKNEAASTINPFIFGNFMEFLERHISGMWAEMLINRRMEEVIAGKGVPEHWRPYLVNNDAYFYLDRNPYNGDVCQAVECTNHYGGYSGIIQKNISVTKGRGYTGAVYLRGEGIKNVEIMLGVDYGVFFQPYAEAKIIGITDKWQKFSFAFTSDATNADTHFAIRFAGPGKLYIDHPSLMPADNMQGWRKDVIEHIKELKPGIIRFPGGCYADIYHWQNAIGPRDARKPQSNHHWSDVPHDYQHSHIRTGKNWRPTEPNDVGMDEFMALCELTGTEALICVNFGTGNAEEAAALVSYLNGGSDTKYGAMRAKNGRVEPYGVKYFQIGNEMYGPWEAGYCGQEGYIKGYKEFHKAMQEASPNISFMIDGLGGDWNRAMLKECAGLFDYIDVHYYPCWDIETDGNTLQDIYNHFFSKLEWVKNQIEELRRDIEEAGMTGKVKAAVCEYNISSGGWGSPRAFMGTQGVALFIAGLVGLLVKNADMIEIGSFSNLTNAWWSSAIRTEREQIHKTPSYYVLAMYAKLLEGDLLPSEVKCGQVPTYAVSVNRDARNDGDRIKNLQTSQSSIPAQDAVCAIDKSKNELTVVAINYTGKEAELEINLDGFIAMGDAQLTYISAPEMHWLNDFPSGDRIKPIKEQISINEINNKKEPGYKLKPCSVSFIKIPVVQK